MAEPSEKDNDELKLIGTTLNNRYKVIDRLGQGGMGTVFRGEHIFMERPVAIKVLHAHLITNKDFNQRFIQEARINSRLSHRNAVILYDFGVEGQMPYLVFEFVEGLTLREVLVKDGKLPVDRFLNIILQVGSALSHAHEMGIVHRDLKPDNIMISHRTGAHEHACVLDFGIAKALKASNDEGSKTVLTKMGMVLGTPQYLSPEQALEKELDARSDIYSLGIIMYEMITGEVPFKSQTSPLEILVAHLNTEPTPIRTLKPEFNIPAEIAEAVEKCLAKDPKDRFQSVAELLKVFTPLKSSLEPKKKEKLAPPHTHNVLKKAAPETSTAPETVSAREASGKPESSGMLFGLMSIVLCAALGGYMYLAQEKTKPETTAETTKVKNGIVEEAPTTPLNSTSTNPPVVAQQTNTRAVVEPVAEPQTILKSISSEERLLGIASLSSQELDDLTTFLENHPARVAQENTSPESTEVTEQPHQTEETTTSEVSFYESIPTDSSSGEISNALFDSRLGQAKKLLQQRNYQEAAREYQSLLRNKGSHLNARVSLGTCYLRLNAMADAKREFEAALQLEPEYAPAIYMLSAYSAKRGDFPAALSSLEHALRLFPGCRKWVSEDEEFEELRKDERYAKLLSNLPK